MKIKRLVIANYRNLHAVDLQLSPKINCFVGNNGMGKTNVLDAIYYLSFCKSSTGLQDCACVKHGEDFFSLKGVYENEASEDTLLCAYRNGERKQVKKNDAPVKRITAHIGSIPLVMISPGDGGLIAGGSEERRKYVDMVISQCDAAYLEALMRYNKALQQRNALLKNEVPDFSVLDVLDEMMALDGDFIYERRKAFVADIQPIFRKIYTHIAGEREDVSMLYVSHGARGGLLEQLKSSRPKDVIVGHTLHGVHKDDLDLLFNDYSVRKEGSQGQRKSYQLAMKLAQFFYLREKGRARTPLLLLDDIFDKLDASRVERIVRYVASDDFGQIFITDTNRDHIDSLLTASRCDHKLFFVEDGNVEER